MGAPARNEKCRSARRDGRTPTGRLGVRRRACDRLCRVSLSAVDGATRVLADVAITDTLTSDLFGSLDDASRFFQRGCDGYSATRHPGRFDGLQLVTDAWEVEAASITEARSSFFDDLSSFPPGSAEVDCALVMRKIPVNWKALPSLDATSPAATTSR